MRALTLSVALAALVACNGDPQEADDAGAEAELEYPSDEEVQAQEAAAKRAGEAVTDENADEHLDELEALIGSEDE